MVAHDILVHGLLAGIPNPLWRFPVHESLAEVDRIGRHVGGREDGPDIELVGVSGNELGALLDVRFA